MITHFNEFIEKLESIEFPNKDNADWSNWPCYPANFVDKSDVQMVYSGDMTQAYAIIHNSLLNILVCDQDNCYALLKRIIFIIFPGEYTWYDLGGKLGCHDYFWYSHSVEGGEYLISDLPRWCQETWRILCEEAIIHSIKGIKKSALFYYVEDFDGLSHECLINIYNKLMPIYIDEIRQYQIEDGEANELEENIQAAKKTFDSLIGMTEEEYINLVKQNILTL